MGRDLEFSRKSLAQALARCYSPYMELSERLDRLETNMAHLEHNYEQLNQVVITQAKQITRLEAELRKSSDTLTTIELDRIRQPNPKPPHYS